MRFATDLSPLQRSSLPFFPLPAPGCLSCHLWISEGTPAHLAGNSRKVLAICLLDSWRNWPFAWPSLPICVGTMFECAGPNPSFPRGLGSPPANALAAAHQPTQAREPLCLLVPSRHRVPVPRHAGLLLSYKPQWLHCCPCHTGAGLSLASFLGGLTRSRSKSGSWGHKRDSNWSKSVGPWACAWLTRGGGTFSWLGTEGVGHPATAGPAPSCGLRCQLLALLC